VPLTEEQRKAKLDDLRVKLAEKRAKQALVNVEENKANEVSRSEESIEGRRRARGPMKRASKGGAIERRVAGQFEGTG
jgi:hypothetical protein